MRNILIMIMWVLAMPVYAHELTPTYFELKPSVYDNIYETQMMLFNRREDVRFYEIAVYDKEWNTIPFATKNKVMKIDYLKKTFVTLYFKKQNLYDVYYVCTTSKLVKGEVISSGIASKICSKIK